MARPVSIQLYTLREQSAQDFRAVVERVAKIGYAGVEPAGLYGMDPTDFASLVADLGMRVSSTHAQGRVDTDDFARVVDEAAAIGAPYLVIPSLPPDRFTELEGIQRLAGKLNAAVDTVESRGMKLGYHNHWFEFVTVDGRTAFDHFVDALDDRIVLEVDIYWAQTGGVDPAALVGGLGARVPLLHVKDGPAVEKEPMLAVGDGKVDIPTVLRANDHVEWHVVELDLFDGDMWEPVERSYTYLTAAGLSEGTR